jgi:hypothetical protein
MFNMSGMAKYSCLNVNESIIYGLVIINLIVINFIKKNTMITLFLIKAYEKE